MPLKTGEYTYATLDPAHRKWQDWRDYERVISGARLPCDAAFHAIATRYHGRILHVRGLRQRLALQHWRCQQWEP